ncbi:efflux RND transporter periplasmic adaptor subunit [Halobacillus fulvus]|nr:efflux RND transporter periplasmic adaptor subunit [Halobacillus fulvus]
MKKKRYKGRILGLLIIAFIATNALLIYIDEDGYVERKSYVEQWSQAFTYDLFETLEKRAVFTTEESNPVYFDDQKGAFKEFLVSEGDNVTQGDDLYTYEVIDYEAQQNQLESEIDRLESEVEAIEDFIIELELYSPPVEESNSSNSFFDDEPDAPENAEVDFLQEQQIAEQEAELAQKEAMLAMVEDQLDQLEDDGQEITITSPYDGTVTDISETLEAPLLTLKSTNLQLEGTLDEEERKSVEVDMRVRGTVEEEDWEITGSLSSIHTFPDETGAYRSSRYPFEVALEPTEHPVLPGYHVDLEIIQAESLQTTSALSSVLVGEEDLYAWVMNEEGQLERREIETGLVENGVTEVVNGLGPGEWLADEPKDEFRQDATFITPIQWHDVYVKRMLDEGIGDYWTYSLLGLLAR